MTSDPAALGQESAKQIALLLNRLVLASIAKGRNADVPYEDRITDEDLEKIEKKVLAIHRRCLETLTALQEQRDDLSLALTAFVDAYNSLTAQVEQLQRTIEAQAQELQAANDAHDDTARGFRAYQSYMQELLAASAARVTRLEAALREFGHHREGCASIQLVFERDELGFDTFKFPDKSCDCGFSAALGAGPSPEGAATEDA